VTEVDDLKALGANDVIPEEFETSIEVFSRVLHHHNVPRNIIHEQVEQVRNDSYRMLRALQLPRKHFTERYDFLKGLDTETYQIRGNSPVEDYSIRQLRLRSETGATVIAVQRGEQVHQNPSPDFTLKAGDVILLVGDRASIDRAIEYMEAE
jgi:CPA2 family monovalent cation:H+ antiporter-2